MAEHHPPSSAEPSLRKRKKQEKFERSKKRKLDAKKAKRSLKHGDVAADQPSSRDTDDTTEWSKSKKKRMRAIKAKLNSQKMTESTTGSRIGGEVSAAKKANSQQTNSGPEKSIDHSTVTASSPATINTTISNNKLQPSATLSKYQARLQGSRFRTLNEQLYTMHSQQAFEQFSSEPQLFEDYHAGFASQVENWPVQPVSVVAEELKRLVGKENIKHANGKKQPSRQHQQLPLVIADFGCGKAELAQDLLQVKVSNDSNTTICPFQVHSFDLVANSDLVTACDMSKTPLTSSTVDMAVFCLSLMGNNLADFIREAHRVLKPSGMVKIVEVRSRFETTLEIQEAASASKDSNAPKTNKGKKSKKEAEASLKPISELKRFTNALDGLGFECVNLDRSNKMFFVLDLRKNGKVPDATLEFTAKPCIYKRR